MVKKTRVELKGSFISFNHGKIVNIYIFYQVNKNFDISSYPTLKNCLFGAVKLTKRPDYDQHKPFWYGIGFGRKGCFDSVMELV